MVNEQIIKVVGYARVSSESQKENTSIEEQKKRIEAHCISRGWELDRIFVDEGKSGSNTDREGYQAMLEYLHNNVGSIQGFVVYKMDRAHREQLNLLRFIKVELAELGIDFVSITESFDTSTALGRVMLGILSTFAEFERDVINERTKSGRVATAKEKKYAGGAVPYGYTIVNDEIVPDKETASIVKNIFELAKEGKSLQRIADTLNDKGIVTNRGKQWSKQTVDYVLKNRAYIGEYEYDGKTERNGIKYKIESIISKQLWNKVHA